MRRILTLTLFCLSLSIVSAQKDSSTYVSGDLPTEYQAFISTNDESYGCTDSLTVTIPIGNFVTAVDVYYDIEATPTGNGWVSEQGSYLELTNTSVKEGAITNGDQNWDSAGVFSYIRTGITDFNGISVTGDLDFFLHAFRTFGQFPVCNSAIQKVLNGSWKIVVHHSAPPTCLEPSGLSFTAIGSDNVGLIWNTGGSSAWQFEYGPTGFTPGSGTLVSALTNPFTINGLLPSTTYDIYVRDSCGPGDVSTWNGPLNITTLCGVFTAPYLENFDGIDWQTGFGGGNANDQISPCWIRPSPNNPNFSTGTGGTGSAGTGPSSDFSGAGNYIYTESSINQGAGEINTPAVFIPSSLPQPALEFVYHMYGAGIDSLYIEVDDGSGFTSVFSLAGEQQTANGDAWIPVSVPFTSYSGDTVVVRFIGVGNSFASDISIDEVAIRTVSCSPPSALQVTNATATTLDVSWTTGGAAQWLVGYRVLGSGAPLTISAVATNPYTITGLTAGTSYEVLVKDSCGVGDVSAWLGPQTGTTLCITQTAPWTENFDSFSWTTGAGGQNNGNQIDACWERPSSANPNFGTRNGPTGSSGFGTGPFTDFSGTGNYIFTEASGNPGMGEITSPKVFIPTTLVNPTLTFRSHMFGGAIDSLWVEVSSNGGAFSQIFSLVGAQQATQGSPWDFQKASMAAFSGDTVQVKFLGENSGFAGDISIDEVSIVPITCPEPTALNFISSTFNSITLDWTTGGATNWLVGYRVAGTTGALTIVSATTNPFTITGLAAETTYEILVRDSCAAGDVSIWQGPIEGSTKCAPIAAPWLETFDGGDWVPGVPNGLNGGNEISGCWSRPTELGPNFGSWTGATQSANTGPSSGNGGAGGYIYTEASGGATGAGLITSPDIIVPASFVNPRLGFFYHMYGAGIDSLVVQVDSGNGFNNNILVLAGQQQSSSNDAWIYFSYDLASYLGDTIAVRFRGVNSALTADIAIDDVGVDDAPLCPKPSNLSVVSVTGNEIQVGWTTGGATDWQIEYGAPGFTPGTGTGTLITVNSNPFTITGLNSSTDYDIYVRDSCGVGQVSLWSDVVSAKTLCGLFLLPFEEDFDSNEWQTGFGAVNTNSQISFCWTTPTGSNPDFSTGNGQTPSAGSGPAGDVSGGGNYIYTEASGGATGAGQIRTPSLYFDPSLTTVNLSFAYHIFGPDIDSFYVSIDNGSTVTSIFSLVGSQQTAINDAWINTTINLDSYLGDTVVIEFTGVNSGFAGDIAVDEVLVDTSTCPLPSNLVVTGVTDNSVSLSWTTGGASNWIVEYGAPGFTPGSGTSVSVSANPTTITGLNPATDYCFFLRDSCGPGSLSDWITVCASTDCSPVSAPWSENFDGNNWTTGLGAANNGNIIDPCWKRPTEQNPNFGPWNGPTASGNTGPSSDFSGNGKYIYTEASGSPGVGEITTPRIHIPSSMTAPRLIFWYHMYGAGVDSLNVVIDDGSGAINQFSLAGEQQTGNNDAWLKASIDLLSYIGDTISITFAGTNSSFQGDMAIDEISLDDITCPAPTNLQVTASTGTSISVSWTTGGSAQWQVGYRPLGSGLPYTIQAAGANPYVIGGLNPGITYEIQVRDSCGTADVSEWVGPVTGSTVCAPLGAPWSEDFDTGSWSEGVGAQNTGDEIDPCWIRSSNTGLRWGTGSGTTPSFNTGPQNDFIVNGNYLFIEASNGNGTATIESPEIFIASQIQNPRLKFAYHFYGAGITSFTIEINDGSGYQVLTTINGQQQTSNLSPWLVDSISLSTYSNDTVRLRFTGTETGFQGDMAIDQLAIVGNLLPCLPPTQMSFSNVSTTTADISWPGSTGSAEVEVVLSGQAQGSGTLYPNAASPLSLIGLNPGTTYDVYIRELCGSLTSTWLDSNFTTTLCPLVQVSFTNQNNLLQVNFDASASVAADSLIWLFGDGNTGVGVNPSHAYAAPGNYPVSLVGFNLCGNYDTIIQNIQVCDSLVGDFSFTTSGDSVFLNASGSIGASQFFWELGDGTDTTGVVINHSYNTAGTKVVQLIVVNLCGDSSIVTKNVKICLPPIASWTYNIISTGANGMQVQFDATASQNASSYDWDFGDGNTLSGQVLPIHTYVTPGLFYQVALKVGNDCGEENTSRFRLNQVSLEELQTLGQMEIYPNPASNQFTFNWSLDGDRVIGLQIIDLSGKVLKDIKLDHLQTGSVSVDISDLPSGSYLIGISTNKGVTDYPLIVK